MRSVPGEQFRFVWNPDAGAFTQSGYSVAAAYPGNAYVDVIGLDAYDQSWAAPQTQTNAWSSTALLDTHQQVAFLISTGIDVTAERAAQATLRESEARYRMLVEGSLGLVCTHDLQDVHMSVNAYGSEILGRTNEEVMGHSLAEFLPEEVLDGFAAYLRRIRTAGEAQGTLYLIHRNGSVT